MEGMNLHYQRKDGLLYPEMEVPGQDLRRVGKYGHLAMRYLKENEESRYSFLYRCGKLEEKMREVDREANEMLAELMDSYLKSRLLQNRRSFLEQWKLLEQAQMQAEEIVLREIVWQYH